MTYEFELPDVGEGVAEGEIVSWLVEVGDAVTEDQPVAEVETDKAVVDVPSPVDGSVAEIRADAGEMVPVGDVIIVFAEDGEETATDEEPSDAPDSTGEPASDTDDERVFAPPSARRLARELDVSIEAVEGTGPSGRITTADVRAHAETDESGSEPTQAIESVETDSVPATSASREITLAAPATRKLAAEEGVELNAVPTDKTQEGEAFVTPAQVQQYAQSQQAAQAADVAAIGAPSGREERIPYRGVRRTIGQQMEASKFTAPHVTHHDEVDVTQLVERRSTLAEVADEQGVSLTYMPFVMKAIVEGLKEFPALNATLDEDAEEIILKHYYNIGIAVATDAGLMVPVVDGVDRKGLLQLSSEMNELIEKARERSIAREEMQGGTFTITNFGAIGGEHATPIINHPESAILGLGEIKEKPRVVDGEVVVRSVMGLSLSIDHRTIDGATAAQFANTVKRYLETPELLLL